MQNKLNQNGFIYLQVAASAAELLELDDSMTLDDLWSPVAACGSGLGICCGPLWPPNICFGSELLPLQSFSPRLADWKY